jgi:CelD/BcsL family acetyltransferase involved in cellulose biosynthesis
LASPYFRPEFSQALGAVRRHVEVAVLEQAGKAMGFLPFERSRWNHGQPVGTFLSDYHGLIATQSVAVDPMELLRGSGLKTWRFEHLVGAQASFAPFLWRESDAWYIDVPESSEVYFSDRANGRRLKSEFGQKMRKLEREVGPMQFVAAGADRNLLATLIEWKSAQYRRMKVANVFRHQWVRDLLEKLLQSHSEDFAAVLSALYAGDTIASIHFGMRSRAVLHGWFPAYNVELARYSPGMLHWQETIKAAPAMGIKRIDLGEGRESFKHRLMTGAIKVAHGTVDVRAGTQAIRRAWWSARDRIRDSRLTSSARVPAKAAMQLKYWLGGG